MSGFLKLVAAAVVSELNDGSRPWAGQLTAFATRSAEFDTGELQTLKVPVIPFSRKAMEGDRGDDELVVVVQIGFEKHTKNADAANDAIADLMEQVADHFVLGSRLDDLETFYLFENEIPAAFDWQLLHAKGIYRSIIRLTFKRL